MGWPLGVANHIFLL